MDVTNPDFAKVAWVASRDLPAENPTAAVSCREIGADLLVTTESAAPVFVATSLPDWPGWRARTDRDEELPLATVNHAFVGFRAPQGRREIRLRYRPRSFDLGVGAFAAGLVGLAVVAGARTARWK